MERDGIHELTAAYALNALDPDDERAYEEHLRRCDRCRQDLASLQEAASSLAFAVAAPEPPPRLRSRLLAAAASERANVVPLRRRLVLPALGAAAAAAAGVAIGLGIWGASVSGSLDEERTALARSEQVLALLADPEASRVPLAGAEGTLVVGPDGRAGLVLVDLPAAPAGKTYEAWVIDGGAPAPAGLFQGGADPTVVPLTRPAASGATVAVTLEDEGGAEAPTSEPILTAPVA